MKENQKMHKLLMEALESSKRQYSNDQMQSQQQVVDSQRIHEMKKQVQEV